jgi:mRNA-degrading endonuclease RelE of RelBE toxin-antitoxin system
MNRIDKFLKKLPLKERNEILGTLLVIKTGVFVGMDIKKMKGESNIYRVRKGKIRIMFEMNGKDIRLVSVKF